MTPKFESSSSDISPDAPAYVPNETLAHPGILELSELLRVLKKQHAEQRIVFTNGCFDILHAGHVDLLTRARSLGHVLVLGLNSDDSVRRLGKGLDRPLNPYSQRAFVLAHLQCVDYVTKFEEDTPFNLISAIKPNVLVKGGDWPVDRIVGADVVQENGGVVHSLPLLSDYSTTALVNRIRRG